MLNRIADTYQRISVGALSWDCIILTGGGSALLYQRLFQILNHENVILADEASSLHLANLRGGLKLSIYLEMEHGNVKVCYLSEQNKFMISEVAKKPRFEPIDERELHSLTSSFMFAVTNSAKSGVSV